MRLLPCRVRQNEPSEKARSWDHASKSEWLLLGGAVAARAKLQRVRAALVASRAAVAAVAPIRFRLKAVSDLSPNLVVIDLPSTEHANGSISHHQPPKVSRPSFE